MNTMLSKFQIPTKQINAALMAIMLTFSNLPIQQAFGQEANTGSPTQRPFFSQPARTASSELMKPRNTHILFSDSPTDSEIICCGAFLEPLVPMNDNVDSSENKALVKALQDYVQRRDDEDISSISKFLEEHSNSRWRAALEMDIAQKCFSTGYLIDAIKYWKSSWMATRNETKRERKAVADNSISNLVQMEARLGLKEDLEKHLGEIRGRLLTGSVEERVINSRNGLKAMQEHPENSFKCGPYSLRTLAKKSKLLSSEKLARCKTLVRNIPSSSRGTNLAQLQDWANQMDLSLQMAKRRSGTEILVPSVMHWKEIGHFAAITEFKDGRYRVEDPTFGRSGGSRWLSAQAIDTQTDGYFLVPNGKLPTGWHEVDGKEASSVWGKGIDGEGVDQSKTPSCPKDCPTCCDKSSVPSASAFSMNGTLNIAAVPAGYDPAVGPSMNIGCNYNYMEGNQPTTFSFANLGPNWSLDWVSYLTDDGSNTTVNVRGGGYEVFQDAGQGNYSFPNLTSQARLIQVSSGVYQRQLPDGSVENFTQQVGSSTRYLMTSVVDPQGNSAILNWSYISPYGYQLSSIVDANGQVTSFNYAVSGDTTHLLISSIVDPFGRTTTFSYDSTVTLLTSIADAVGNQTTFSYSDASSSFINLMTTPYGSTSFRQYTPTPYVQPYINNWDLALVPVTGLEFTLPDGTNAVVESWLGDDTSHFWDREAMSSYPSDPQNHVYTHCKNTQWMIDTSAEITVPVPCIVGLPLEAPHILSYGTNTYNFDDPTSNKPIRVLQQLGPCRKTLTITQVPNPSSLVLFNFGNGFAFPVSRNTQYTVPPSGETTTTLATHLAAAINSDSLLQELGISATANSNTLIISSLTLVDSATNPFSITPTSVGSWSNGPNPTEVMAVSTSGTSQPGDQVSITIADSGLPLSAQTISYAVQSGDTALTIAQGLAGLVNANANFQALGISAFWTNSYYQGIQAAPYTTTPVLCFQSNSPNPTTYSQSVTPSGNTRQSVTVNPSYSWPSNVAAWSFERNNTFFNATKVTDPIGRQFNLSYAKNNIDLTQLSEIKTGSNQIAAWAYDNNHQPVQFTDGSGQTTYFAYNSFEQLSKVTDALGNNTTIAYNNLVPLSIVGAGSGSHSVSVTLNPGSYLASFPVTSGMTASQIATGLSNAINTQASANSLYGVSAIANDGFVEVQIPPSNSLASVTSSDPNVTLTEGSVSEGFPIQVQGALAGNNDISKYLWNFTGTLNSFTDSEGYTIQLSYDNLDRPTVLTYPDGTTEKAVYNKLDLVSSADRLGRWTTQSFDSMDQLVNEVDPLGRTTSYSWCSCGSLASLTNNSATTTWHHDLQGRVIRKIFPDDTAINYTYDPARGLLSSRTDPLKQTTYFAYNYDDTLQAKSYLNAINPTSSVITNYDFVFPRETSLSNGWGTYTYSYNPYVSLPAASSTVYISFGGNPQGGTNPDTVSATFVDQFNTPFFVSYQETSSDTGNPAQLAADFAGTIQTNLSTYGFSASANGALVTVIAGGPITPSVSATGQTAAQCLSNSANVWIGGTPGSTDTVTVTLNTSGGPYTVNYSVVSGDVGNPQELALDLAAAIQAQLYVTAGITASANGTSVNIVGTSALTATSSATGGTIAQIGGGGRLSQVSSSVIANSAVSYGYDALGRRQNRMINGASNSTKQNFDAIGRVTGETNQLGTFNYTFVDDTPGTSTGCPRLASIGYPNSQSTNFSWLPNICDQRLQQISNLNPSATVLSQFNHAYNQAGEITQWLQKQNGNSTHLSLGYDCASQLTDAPVDSGSTYYAYISGTVHPGDLIKLTAYDASLTSSSGQISATYQVQPLDTAALIAQKLISNSGNTGINQIMGGSLGVSASQPNSAIGTIQINTSSNKTTQFTCSVSGSGVTDTITLSGNSPNPSPHFPKQLYFSYDNAGNRTGVQGDSSGSFTVGSPPPGLTVNSTQYKYNQLNQFLGSTLGGPVKFKGSMQNPVKSVTFNLTQTATISGYVAAYDMYWMAFHNSSLNQAEYVFYTPFTGAQASDVAYGLADRINHDSVLSGLGITATASGPVISMTAPSSTNPTTVTAGDEFGYASITPGGGSVQAAINPANKFTANPILSSGPNGVNLIATSGGGTNSSTAYPITVNSATPAALSYDLNGNLVYDGSNSYLWDAENRLVEIDYGVLARTNVSLANSGSLAANPNGNYVYAIEAGSTSPYPGSVQVISTSSQTVIQTVNIGNYPQGSVVTPNGNYLLVANNADGTVSVMNTSTYAVSTVTVGGAPTSVVVTPNGNYAYVLNQDVVNVIKLSTLTVIANISGFSGTPSSIAMNPNGNFVYVLNPVEGTAIWLTAISTSTNTISKNLNLFNYPRDPRTFRSSFTVTPDGKQIYVASWFENSVYAVNTTSYAVTQLGINVPWFVAVTPDSKTAYVTSGYDQVSVIDTASNTQKPAIILPAYEPYGIQITPDGSQIWVDYLGGAPETVISTANNTVITTLNGIAVGVFAPSNPVYAFAYNGSPASLTILNVGSQNSTQLTYDSLSRCTEIQEKGSVPSYSGNAIKQFVWSGEEQCEERDSAGNLVKQFFPFGQIQLSGTPTSYFYERNHRGDVVGVDNSSGGEITSITYDPFGLFSSTYLSGTFSPDFGFAGLYFHPRSNLNLATYRAYNPASARWLSRDPIGENGGTNLYAYCGNNPISFRDPSGLDWQLVVSGRAVVPGASHTNTLLINNGSTSGKATGGQCLAKNNKTQGHGYGISRKFDNGKSPKNWSDMDWGSPNPIGHMEMVTKGVSDYHPNQAAVVDTGNLTYEQVDALLKAGQANVMTTKNWSFYEVPTPATFGLPIQNSNTVNWEMINGMNLTPPPLDFWAPGYNSQSAAQSRLENSANMWPNTIP